MIWRLPHPLVGLLAFVGVWMGAAMAVGFGAGMPEVGGLTLLATAAFVLINRRPARRTYASS